MRIRSACAVVAIVFVTALPAAAQLQKRGPTTLPAASVEAKRLTATQLGALRQGGEVRLSPGVYGSRALVTIRGVSNFSLVGDAVTLRTAIRFEDCHNFRIEGITFDGARATLGDAWDIPTLRIVKCSNFKITDCQFNDARGDHLYIAEASRNGIVRDCRFTDAWRNAISVINAHHLRFEGNTIDTVRGEVLGAGMDIEGNEEDPIGCNHDITVVGNTFRNCAESGVRITNGREPYRIDVIDNTFENCPTGVLVGGRDCRIRGNQFLNAKRPDGKIGEEARAQVYLNGTRAGGITEISGNRFQKLDGIGGVRSHVTWNGPVLVLNNVFLDLAGKQINAVSIYSSDAVVSGNVVIGVENGIGIGISGRDATVTNNVLRHGAAGPGALWSDVNSGFYSGNRVSKWVGETRLPAGNEIK